MNWPVDFFKDLIWDNLVRASLEAFFVKVPLLGWGPFRTVITYFVTKYSDALYEGVSIYINVQQIILKNKELEKEFTGASVRLKIVAKGFGWTSPEFEETRNANKERLSQFVRFDFAR